MTDDERIEKLARAIHPAARPDQLPYLLGLDQLLHVARRALAAIDADPETYGFREESRCSCAWCCEGVPYAQRGPSHRETCGKP